jgi:hypothetical protein
LERKLLEFNRNRVQKKKQRMRQAVSEFKRANGISIQNMDI